jgi:hypothetical protein
MSRKDCAPLITPAVTTLDSANIAVINNTNYNSYTGSAIGQAEITYLLSPKYTFQGTLTDEPNEVGWDYGILQAPPSSGFFPQTSQTDFKFYLNGVLLEDSQVVGFQEDGLNYQSSASFNLGFDLRDYDVVTAVGKFKV